jgi:hypothetical protein
MQILQPVYSHNIPSTERRWSGLSWFSVLFWLPDKTRAGSISNVAIEGAHDGSWNNRSAMDYRIQFDFQKGRALEIATEIEPFDELQIVMRNFNAGKEGQVPRCFAQSHIKDINEGIRFRECP